MPEAYTKQINGRELRVFKDDSGEWAYTILFISDAPRDQWACLDVGAIKDFDECVKQAEDALNSP